MDILGSIGKLYTFLLLVVLFLGSGFAVWAGINAIMNKKDDIKENTNKIKEYLNLKYQNIKNKDIIGGLTMKNNGFIKLAVFSFVGIIISAAILTALPKSGNSMGYMNTQNNMASMNMQGSMYGQASMQGMTNYNSQGAMNGSADLYSIQQQLNYIQQQIYQLQNQMNNNSMNGMQSNSGSSMNNMGNSNNMNNNNSMNNMGNSNNMNNNSSMNNMNNSNNMNNNNSSSSSMPMM